VKNENLINAVSAIDDDLIEEFVKEDMKRSDPKIIKRKKELHRYLYAVAACLVLAIGLSILMPIIARTNRLTGTVPLFNHLEDPTQFSNKTSYHFGNFKTGTSPSPTSPTEMYDRSFSIVAKAVEVLPDLYSIPEYEAGTRYYHADAYKVLKMNVINNIFGNGFPNEIYYLLPAYLDPDLTEYQHIVLALTQLGAEDALLINQSRMRYEKFSFTFMCAHQNNTNGGVLAFNNNKLDSSLWEKKGWDGGGLPGAIDFPADYGCSLDYTIHAIQQLNKEFTARKVSSTKDLKSEEAASALSYVQPFLNGSFIQKAFSNEIRYYRTISGFLTNESISLDENGSVKKYGEQFTKEDLKKLPDIEKLMTTLDFEKISPPHTKNLSQVNIDYVSVIGKYYKNNGVIYGVIRINWNMSDKKDNDMLYRDDMYILMTSDGAYRPVERDELQKYIGDDKIINKFEYGKISWRVNV